MSERRLKDRYEIVSTLGQGTVTSTHLAIDHQSGRRCVVKVVSMRSVDALKAHELLMREARVLLGLDHPRIPRFVDYFTEEDGADTRACLVTQYVDGKSLAELVRGGRRFTENEACRIGAELAGILEYLHGFSPPILHRDLKPANVLLTGGDRVYLVDFGAVRDHLWQQPVLFPGGPTIVGTPGYMPLEQFEGDAVPRSDLYSLGATLVTMLSGRAPAEFDKTGLKLDVAAQLSVSPDLLRLLGRLLEPDWRDRPASAAEVRQELERLATTASRRPWTRRTRLTLAAGPALLAVALGLSLWRVSSHGDRQAVERGPEGESAGPSWAPWASSGRDALGDSLPRHALRRLGTVRLRHGGGVSAVAISPDGSTIASASQDGTASLWSAATGEELRRFDLGAPATALALAPDGRRLLVGTERFWTAWILDVEGRAVARLLPLGTEPAPSVAVSEVAWSGDGRVVATRVHGAIDLWSGADGRHLRRLSACGRASGLAFLEGRASLLVGCDDGTQRVVGTASGREQRRIAFSFRRLPLRVLSARRLLAFVEHGGVTFVEASSGEPAGTLDAGRGESSISSADLSHDGKTIVLGMSNGTLVAWDVTTRSRRRTFEGHVGPVTALALSSDGRTLVSGGADHTVRVFDVETEKERLASVGHRGAVQGLSFSPDGDALLSAGADATLRRWGRAGDEPSTWRFTGSASAVVALPGSRWLVVAADRYGVFDEATGWEVTEMPLPRPLNGVAVAPRAGLLAAGSGSSVEIFELASGARRVFPVPRQEEPVAFSADGRVFATLREEAERLAGRPLVVRDAATGRELALWPHNRGGPYPARCRSADGSYVMFNAGLWRLTSKPGALLANAGWTGRARGCAVSPDGNVVAFPRDEPDTIEVRARTGNGGKELQRVGELRGHRGPVTSLVFSPDSRTLVSGGADASILFWDMEAVRREGSVASAAPPEAPPPSATTVPAEPRLRLSFDDGIGGPGVTRLRWAPSDGGMRLVPGRVGQALHLDSSLRFPETRGLVVGDEFTVELWFRIDREAVAERSYHAVLSSELVTVDVREGGNAYVFVHFLRQGGHASVDLAPWMGRVEPNRWYHLGVSYRRSDALVRICVDGVCGPGPTGAYFADRTGELELGRSPYQQRFGGAIDELAIYDRALSDDEMAAAAGQQHARLLPTPTPPAAPPTAAPVPAEGEPMPMEALPQGRDVSSNIAVEERRDFTAYRFKGGLGRVQTLDLDLGLGSVWVGTSRGLLRHDPRTGSWLHWDETAGIPGERLDEIALAGGRVFADTSKSTGPGTAVWTYTFSFDPARGLWSRLETSGGPWDLWGDGETLWLGLGNGAEMRDLETGAVRRFTREAGQLLHGTVHAVRRHGSTVWFAMMGDYVKETKDFTGGGVTVWDRASDRFTSFTEKDGLARGYSCDIFVDESEVWVAHWDAERGLSHLERRTGRWEVVRKSANGIDLGGVLLAGDADTLWIGQQGALVRLDRRTRQAMAWREQDGLPGYIVSGLAVAADAVWASVYSYGQDGVRSAGVVRLPRRGQVLN